MGSGSGPANEGNKGPGVAWEGDEGWGQAGAVPEHGPVVELATSVPWLGRAGPWAAGDWPCCYGVPGAWADGPRVLTWGLGCGQGQGGPGCPQ